MINENEIDLKLFSEIKSHAADLKVKHAARNLDFEKYEDMYLLRWEEAQKAKFKRNHARVVLSPDPRNAVIGMVRLMVGTDPIFHISENGSSSRDERLEESINRCWNQSGRKSGIPIHHDLLTSAILYAEMHTAVTLTSDLLKQAEVTVRNALTDTEKLYANAQLERARQLSKIVPAVIESWNPKNGYPEFDVFGLSAYYRESKVKVADLITRFGQVPEQYRGKSRYDEVNLYLFYDTVYTCFWTDAGPLLLKPHGLDRIPVSVQMTDGSNLFDKPEESRQPALYTILKANLWDQQNLAMTVLYTSVFAYGSTPTLVHTSPPGGPKELVANFDGARGIYELEANERLDAVVDKGLIDPSLSTALSLATSKTQESTIYPQTLGQPLSGGSNTFSEAALMAQAGRLPLIGPQKRGAWGISGVVELMLAMIKSSGETFKSNNIEFVPSQIPSDIQVDTKLDVKLPQDKLQQANVASILKAQGLASAEWIQENILQMSSTERMQTNIWAETAETVMFQNYLRELMMKSQQAQQAQQVQEQKVDTESAMPGGDGEMTAGATTSNVQGAQSAQGGLPQAQMGMMPGQGKAMVPDQEKVVRR